MIKNNKKILLVEDDEDFLSILEKVLTAEGFAVLKEKDGEGGAQTAIKEKPDLVISDVLMPKLDGHMMAKKIEEAGAKCPIIFLTNVGTQEQQGKDFEYLIKTNLHIDQIVQRIKEKLGV